METKRGRNRTREKQVAPSGHVEDKSRNNFIVTLNTCDASLITTLGLEPVQIVSNIGCPSSCFSFTKTSISFHKGLQKG